MDFLSRESAPFSEDFLGIKYDDTVVIPRRRALTVRNPAFLRPAWRAGRSAFL
jgi:hypothetical protein